MLVRHSELNCPRTCSVLSYTVFVSSYVQSEVVKKSSSVSHTVSRIVRTCCLRSPSAGLRPPLQLTSNCIVPKLVAHPAVIAAVFQLYKMCKKIILEIIYEFRTITNGLAVKFNRCDPSVPAFCPKIRISSYLLGRGIPISSLKFANN
jgi:hypothetical protein